MRTKPLIAFAALMLLVPRSAPAGPERPRLGFDAGFDYARVEDLETSGPTFATSPFRPAWSLGAVCEVPLGRSLALATGVRYLAIANRGRIVLVSGSDAYDATLRSSWSYLGVPVLLEWRLGPASAPFLVGGGECACLLDVRQRIDLSSLRSGPVLADPRVAAAPAAAIFESVSPTHPLDLYHRLDVALVGGVGYRMALRSHPVVAQLRYRHGLVNLVKIGPLDERTRALELLAGWRW